MQARIWTAMVLSAVSAIALASATGCAVRNSNGELSGSARTWIRLGRFTDRIVITKPYMDEDAYLDTDFAGDPAAPCPQQAIAGANIEKP
jgi:hypothetical protein